MTQTTTAPSKPFWQSTTLQGVVVTVLGQVLAALEANGTIPSGTGVDGSALIGHLIATLGLIVTVIGRFRAKGSVTIS